MRDQVSRPWHSLRHYRAQRKLSLERLAELAGLSRQYVGFLERGERPPTDKATIALARALAVEPDQLRIEQAPNPTAPEVLARLELQHRCLGEQLNQLRAHIGLDQGAA